MRVVGHGLWVCAVMVKADTECRRILLKAASMSAVKFVSRSCNQWHQVLWDHLRDLCSTGRRNCWVVMRGDIMVALTSRGYTTGSDNATTSFDSSAPPLQDRERAREHCEDNADIED